MADSTADPRKHVAFILWSANEGYLSPQDRADGPNWFLEGSAETDHPDDHREDWLAMADEVLARVVALEATNTEQALNDLADEFDARLPDGTGNGRAYNSYTVARMIREFARRVVPVEELTAPRPDLVRIYVADAIRKHMPIDIERANWMSKELQRLGLLASDRPRPVEEPTVEEEKN